MTAAVRWLFVVRRERRDLYEDLRRNFSPDRRVRVILDRRQRDRRVQSVPERTDRRRQERRSPPTAKGRALWETAGFRLFYQDEDMKVFEATNEARDQEIPPPTPGAAP